MSLPPLNYKYYREDYEEMLADIRTSQEPTGVLMKRYNICTGTVQSIRNSNTNPKLRALQDNRAEQYKEHRRTIEQILVATGTIAEISERFGVHHRTVSNARRRNKLEKRLNTSFFEGRTYRAIETPLPPLSNSLSVREKLARTIAEFFE